MDKALYHLKDTCPAIYTVDNLDSDLAAMTLIRSLPDNYRGFVSSLILLDSEQIDYPTIKEAFALEESTHGSSTGNNADVVAAAAAAFAPTLSTSSTLVSCLFCSRNFHTLENCHKFKAASETAKEEVKSFQRSNNKKGKYKRPQRVQAHQKKFKDLF